ncbi:Rhodanese-like protein [Hesseltinella vesiculosa]|uniref:Rhodanese-like protein n=1 Tax=Hesseltinella vesiculosa TaxID=101127 RepID=A0A1X2G987_9FUNG|nr:Rhodanese-like protein [Hesseltinella vesiculosa]
MLSRVLAHRPVIAGFTARLYSTKVDFDHVQSLVQNKNKSHILIDVREKNELLKGAIPTARNIPLSQFALAWQAEDDDFEHQFGFTKPDRDTTLVVYCQAGVRSAKAADYLESLGYQNVENYQGSWADYAAKTSNT